jgi:quercetin dioxygenase-like cupin family protein
MNTVTAGLSEVIDVAPGLAAPGAAGTSPLIKSDHLTVVRLELPKGKQVPPHHAKGEITVHCLKGKVEFTAGEITRTLCAGQLVLLAGRETHSLVATDDSTLLVTVAS